MKATKLFSQSDLLFVNSICSKFNLTKVIISPNEIALTINANLIISELANAIKGRFNFSVNKEDRLCCFYI